jgi:hypothetical protein
VANPIAQEASIVAIGEPGDRYVVISADTHAGADLYDYKPYLPSRLHDEFDTWAATYNSPFDDLIIATAKRNWDHEFRLKEMDADGVAGRSCSRTRSRRSSPPRRTSRSACRAHARSSSGAERGCRLTTGGRSTSAPCCRPGDAA